MITGANGRRAARLGLHLQGRPQTARHAHVRRPAATRSAAACYDPNGRRDTVRNQPAVDTGTLDVQLVYELGVVLDELEAEFRLLAHQGLD